MLDLRFVIDYLAYNGIFYLVNEPMQRHTTFQIGGVADIVADPTRRREICDLTRICKTTETPLTVIGNGSNILVSDKGVRGLVIMTDRLRRVSVSGTNTIEAWAGAPIAKAANLARNYSLAGLEFAYGIPGTVGGAVYMNAGAYNRNMDNVVTETEYVDNEGRLKTMKGDEHQFGYRKSVFRDTDFVIVKTVLTLTEGNSAEITAKMNEYTRLRAEKQPLDMPSAGSVFKRPPGFFAGRLVEDSGLKGYQIGGARVSDKHAGFIVNTGNATCGDVIRLIETIRETVLRKFGVELESEIRVIGEA